MFVFLLKPGFLWSFLSSCLEVLCGASESSSSALLETRTRQHCQLLCQTLNALFFSLLEEEQRSALCSTLSEILESACAGPSTGFCLVTWAKGQSPHAGTQTQSQSQSQDVPEPASSQTPQEQQPSEFCIPHMATLHASTLECSTHS